MDSTIQWTASRRRLPRYGFHFTLSGWLYLAGTAIVGLVGINSEANLLIVLFGLCLGAIAVSAFSSWIALRKLSVSRSVCDVIVAHQPFIVRYTVTNRRPWSATRSLQVVDILPSRLRAPQPEAYVPILRAGESITLHAPAVCPVRGRLSFTRIGLATRFPFGLFTKYAVVESRHDVIVFPELGQLTSGIHLKADAHDAPGGGDGPQSHILGDEEYYGIREYRLGDNPRRIHWRRSARTGQLMVREMTRNRTHQVWCVVNTRIQPSVEAEANLLELAIQCAATVVCDLLERGAKVGLMCNGEPLLVLPPGGGRAHRPRLLRELALREPNYGDDLTPHIQRLTWPARWRGPCLLFGAADTDELRRAARALGQMIGPASIYIAGSSKFEEFFVPSGRARRRSPGATGLATVDRRTLAAVGAH